MWPYPSASAAREPPALSAKSFDGVMLKQSQGYNGSALLAFTLNVTTDKSCSPCNELDALMRQPAFKSQLGTWWDAGVVRIGKIYCNQQQDLCARFGVTDYPHLLWFKGGTEAAPYDGERTLEGFVTWVSARQGEGVL